MGPRRLLVSAVFVAALCVPAAPALADGRVSAVLTLPPPDQRPAAPQRSHGFLPRAKNPLKPVRAYDPLPYMVVVLEGDVATTGAASDPVRYTLVGEAFDKPLLAVSAGTKVEIRNAGARSPRLYSPVAAKLLPGTPINPTDSLMVTVSSTNTLITIRDRDSIHLIGRLVAFPHSLFAQPDDDGKVVIDDVPEGTYTVKVWYRDGWLKIRPITVEVNGGTERLEIAIPAALATEQ